MILFLWGFGSYFGSWSYCCAIQFGVAGGSYQLFCLQKGLLGGSSFMVFHGNGVFCILMLQGQE